MASRASRVTFGGIEMAKTDLELLAFFLAEKQKILAAGYLALPHNADLHESESAKRGGSSGFMAYCPHCAYARLDAHESRLVSAREDTATVDVTGKARRIMDFVTGKEVTGKSMREIVMDDLNERVARFEAETGSVNAG